jgi:hypothetical protein
MSYFNILPDQIDILAGGENLPDNQVLDSRYLHSLRFADPLIPVDVIFDGDRITCQVNRFVPLALQVEGIAARVAGSKRLIRASFSYQAVALDSTRPLSFSKLDPTAVITVAAQFETSVKVLVRLPRGQKELEVDLDTQCGQIASEVGQEFHFRPGQLALAQRDQLISSFVVIESLIDPGHRDRVEFDGIPLDVEVRFPDRKVSRVALSGLTRVKDLLERFDIPMVATCDGVRLDPQSIIADPAIDIQPLAAGGPGPGRGSLAGRGSLPSGPGAGPRIPPAAVAPPPPRGDTGSTGQPVYCFELTDRQRIQCQCSPRTPIEAVKRDLLREGLIPSLRARIVFAGMDLDDEIRLDEALDGEDPAIAVFHVIF